MILHRQSDAGQSFPHPLVSAASFMQNDKAETAPLPPAPGIAKWPPATTYPGQVTLLSAESALSDDEASYPTFPH